MSALQVFAEAAAGAVEELIQHLPKDQIARVERKMAKGCRLSLSMVTQPDGPPEILLELQDDHDNHVRLISVDGQLHHLH